MRVEVVNFESKTNCIHCILYSTVFENDVLYNFNEELFRILMNTLLPKAKTFF